MRTPKQNKAIAWYCLENNLIPQLSAHPIYRFKNRYTGDITEVDIVSLTASYEGRTKANKRKEKS